MRTRLAAIVPLLLVAALMLAGPASAETPTIGNAPTVGDIEDAVDYNYAKDAPILRLYQAFFNRAPDLAGARYWLTVRRTNFNELDIAEFMSQGEEFKNLYDGTTDEVFVERVYTNVLGREFDQAGYIYWLDILKGTNVSGNNPERKSTDRPGVVNFITQNPEFTTSFPFGEPNPTTGGNLNDQPTTGFVQDIYASTNPGDNCFWSAPSAAANGLYGLDRGLAIQVVADLRAADSVTFGNCGTLMPIRDADLGLIDAIAGPADWVVGTQVLPGVYRAQSTGKCSFSRAADANHTFNGAVDTASFTIDTFLDPAHLLVEIKEGDAFFIIRHNTCDTFESVNVAELPTEQNPGNGIWAVGPQMTPGTWQATGDEFCVWVRSTEITGTVLDASLVQQGTTTQVTVNAGEFFSSKSCGTWTRTGSVADLVELPGG